MVEEHSDLAMPKHFLAPKKEVWVSVSFLAFKMLQENNQTDAINFLIE